MCLQSTNAPYYKKIVPLGCSLPLCPNCLRFLASARSDSRSISAHHEEVPDFHAPQNNASIPRTHVRLFWPVGEDESVYSTCHFVLAVQVINGAKHAQEAKRFMRASVHQVDAFCEEIASKQKLIVLRPARLRDNRFRCHLLSALLGISII